jgi:hypothetical protein
MMLEKATQFVTRGDGPRAMLEALRRIHDLRPPCWRVPAHGTATRVVSLDGHFHAVCKDCAAILAMDRQVKRQRQERARMRGR